jgi:hypothetical protein
VTVGDDHRWLRESGDLTADAGTEVSERKFDGENGLLNTEYYDEARGEGPSLAGQAAARSNRAQDCASFLLQRPPECGRRIARVFPEGCGEIAQEAGNRTRRRRW